MWFQLQRIPRKKRKHNIKKFKNAIDLDILKNPNVSYCEDDNELHYNLDPRLIVKYLVDNDSEPTQLYMYVQEGDLSVVGSEMFDKVEIDNVEVSISDLDTARGTYQLSAGEHTVKYTLKDPTLIGADINTDLSSYSSNYGATFAQCISVSEVIIPNSITTIGISTFVLCAGLVRITIGNNLTNIGQGAFMNCRGLTNITIPNSVTTIGNGAFAGCTGLTSITSLATIAPTIENATFRNVKSGGTLTVPSGSTGYDVWMDTGDYYLGKYSWTKIEQ